MNATHQATGSQPRPGLTNPPSWFNNAVVTGMQMLYTLQLPRTPGADVMPLTTITWVRALWRMPRMWDQERDTQRLADAFYGLAGNATEWPAAKHLLDHLPPVAKLPALVAPVGMPDARRLAELQRVRDRTAEVVRMPAAARMTAQRFDQVRQRLQANAEPTHHPVRGGEGNPNPHDERGILRPDSSHVAGGAGEGVTA